MYLGAWHASLVYMSSVPADPANGAGLLEPANRDSARQPAIGIAQGAALIAVLTVVSRLLGLVRTLVFSQTVGADCLGTAYATANQVPNLIYELALGGALTSAMIPILARSAGQAHADPAAKARVAGITSALLTWAMIILVPLTAAIVMAAGPIASLLNPVNPNVRCPHADMVGVTSTMIVVFAPQVILYGLSVILFGLLQAYRRFTGPALAPIVASGVLITSYLLFVPLDKELPLARTPLAAVLVLAVGTTLNIGALAVVALGPARRLRLRFRPAFRFPPGVAGFVGGLALVGVIEFLANDLSTVVVIDLANGRGDTGALVLFNYAWLVFNAVYAVLALSVTTSAFPVLSARDGAEFDQTSAASTRAVLLLAWLGAAVIAAIAVPVAHVLASHPDQVPQLIGAFAMFAPGVAGVAVITNLSRVMFALGKLKVAGAALTVNWLLVVVADLALAEFAPPHLVVGALALGNTIGQSLVAVPLVIAARRIRGKAAVARVGHANIAGLAAAVAAAAAGTAIRYELPAGGKLSDAGVAVAAAGGAVVAFVLVAGALDLRDLRAVMRQVRRRLGRAAAGS
jgi:putative peptidoglycan lipid II flippase